MSSSPVEGRVAPSELPFDRKPRPSTEGVAPRPRQRLSLQPTGTRPLPARSPASNPRPLSSAPGREGRFQSRARRGLPPGRRHFTVSMVAEPTG
ncbi:uncharacterized protein N7500_009008 [Penicillium coprophilum]|uniref:uncharacterized protein n=1 Tax=Penicillium coprophilum TaxID=36646 RepID=UPI0023941C08|nr:uncharacterized protein N7500_009008 [Penicillium coprophilum]KAJ5159357.1 hypothetical protein N7500_009008 [Penicillium coprophilum]